MVTFGIYNSLTTIFIMSYQQILILLQLKKLLLLFWL